MKLWGRKLEWGKHGKPNLRSTLLSGENREAMVVALSHPSLYRINGKRETVWGVNKGFSIRGLK